MPVSIATEIVDTAWNSIPGISEIAEATAAHALNAATPALRHSDQTIELCIVLAGDELLQTLNRTYRGKDKPTNVLSFPLGAATPSDPAIPLLLGDVVLAFQTIADEAVSQDKLMIDHVRHLVVHGVLHLLGHDHEASSEAARMETLEIEILAGIGVADPYSVLT